MKIRINELKQELVDAKTSLEQFIEARENAARAKGNMGPRLEAARKKMLDAQSEFGRVAVSSPGTVAEDLARRGMASARAQFNQIEAELSAVESAAEELLSGTLKLNELSSRVGSIEISLRTEVALTEIEAFDPKVLEPLFRAWAIDPRYGQPFPQWFATVFGNPFMKSPDLSFQKLSTFCEELRTDVGKKYGID